MATWDIVAAAEASSIGETASGNSTVTPAVPSDFDGAVIDSVTILSAPTIDSDAATNDSLGIRWHIGQPVVSTYGNGATDATSLCYALLGGGSPTTATIVVGSGTSPAPTIAVAADWQQVNWSSNYSSSGMPDAETCTWSAFTIRVDYTPSGGSDPILFRRRIEG